jgi:septal ring factor EnvC (AmiA/AmiB activator)
LKRAVTASLAEDARLEIVSVTNFNSLVTEMNKVHANLDKEISETVSEIKDLRVTLAARRATKAQKLSLRTRAVASLKSTHEAQDSYNRTYKAETMERSREVATIARVIVIIKQHSGAINRSAKLPTKF